MQEERDKLIDLLPKKKPELDLRESQPMQMVKDANIRGFIVRKAYSRDEARVWLDNLLTVPPMDLKVKVSSHIESSLRASGMSFMDPLSHLSRGME